MVRSKLCESGIGYQVTSNIPFLVTNCSIKPSLKVESTSSPIGPSVPGSSSMNMNNIIGISPILEIFHSSIKDSISTSLLMSSYNGIEIT